MFSCCRPTSGGSGSQEPQGCGLFQCSRHWLQHRYQGVRAVIRRRRQGAGALAGKRHQIALMKSSQTELLEHKVRQLLLALQRRDVISICSFLDDYRGFATTDEVLDLLFTEQHMPSSDVELRARRNLQQFRLLHTVEPEAGAQERVPALTVGTAAPSGPAGIQAFLAAGAEGSARAEVPAGEAKPLQIVVTALVHCSALEEPPAPAATPEEEQNPAPAIGVPRVPEPPPASGTTGFDP
ncbi:uncharacterized protein LOC119869163 [Canis lupus familiaris]|uniref:uncharacterized protein LOC119869163 n=1 Tax=Canis lupus familiaris TaxID=9615 RepID=UPI0018F5773F|nr:uncharacterized protein LOC119869163 [Canis lupus familiaris]